MEILKQMRHENIEPDIISYNSAITACAKSKQTNLALSLLSEMEQYGIKPESIAFNAAIAACTTSKNSFCITTLIYHFKVKEQSNY